MRDHPDTDLLVASARRALLEQVVPHLGGEERGVALMVARVLQVVGARLQSDRLQFATIDAGGDPADLASLAALLELDAGEVRRAAGGTAGAITELSRRLVARIRAGDFDPPGPRHDELARFLEAATRAKLRESNPKVLDSICEDERQ